MRIIELDVPIVGWPTAANGLRIGHISDLHCDNGSDVRRILRASELLMAQKPDIVFVTGDYLTKPPVAPNVAACLAALRPLRSAPRGVFAVLGNHDYQADAVEEIAKAMGKEGITLLRNQSVALPGVPGVWLVGVDDLYTKHDDVNQALRGVPEDAIKIVLVHEPDFADRSPPGFALQFSGHSHGGQIRFPGLKPLYLPDLGQHYYEGLCQSPNHPIYVTRGVGMVYPKIRLFCPSEVALVRITAKEG